MKATSKQDTWLRRVDNPLVSIENVPGYQKRFVKGGETFQFRSGQRTLESGQKWLAAITVDPYTAAEGNSGYFNWLLFMDHWDIHFDDVILNVQFWNQLDNAYDPHRTCNSTVHAMLLKYLRPNRLRSDDEYIQWVRFDGRDTTDHNVHTHLLREQGIVSHWKTDLNLSDVRDQVSRNIPVPLGILHRGSSDNPTGGHIILCVGYNARGLVCHDPYGSLHDGYTLDVSNGEYVTYTWKQLDDRWLEGGRDNSGWGRLVA